MHFANRAAFWRAATRSSALHDSSKCSIRNANGVESIQPKVGATQERLPWVCMKNGDNPERVASADRICVSVTWNHRRDATPLGLLSTGGRVPRVARSSQPWAERWNAVGVLLPHFLLPDILLPAVPLPVVPLPAVPLPVVPLPIDFLRKRKCRLGSRAFIRRAIAASL